MDILCFLWNSKERGEITSSPQHLAQMVGMECSRFEVVLNSLESKGICDVRRTSDACVTLMSRRMRREGDALEKNRQRQEKYRISKNLRQKRYREKMSNALVTHKKSEVRSQKLDKDFIAAQPQTNANPALPGGEETATTKPFTDIQKIVRVFKIVSGYDKDDKGWDKLNFARCARSAKLLRDFLGDWKRAGDCVQDVYEKLSSKGLTVTLETVVKHAADWNKDKLEKESRNGILPVPSL